MTSDQTIILPSFHQARVLVYGDVMLDRYWKGETLRISPEAPVPVVNVMHSESRPGGAANVACNIAELGGQVTLFGLTGDDVDAVELKNCLNKKNLTYCFQTVSNFPTTTKLRVLSANHQLIRMDFENNHEIEINDDELFSIYAEKLRIARVVVLSDYSKGALCHVERLIQLARDHDVPVLVDPKHKSYQRYTGASILTPNLKELESVTGKCRDLSEVIQKSRELLSQINIDSLLVTLGKDGVVFIERNRNKEAVHFPAQAKDVFDVTGAGDTVIAVLAAAIASNMNILSAVELANIAAGVVVGRLGTQMVTVADLQDALPVYRKVSSVLTRSQLLSAVSQAKLRKEKIVMTNGCFDILHAGHVDYLAKAKAMGDRLIVAVNDDNSVHRLKGDSRPVNTLAARMAVLSALTSVDWVVPFSEDTPEALITSVLPDVLVKGGDYQIHEIAGAQVVMKNGGHVTTIPLVNGFSTTQLIKNMQKETVALPT